MDLKLIGWVAKHTKIASEAFAWSKKDLAGLNGMVVPVYEVLEPEIPQKIWGSFTLREILTIVVFIGADRNRPKFLSQAISEFMCLSWAEYTLNGTAMTNFGIGTAKGLQQDIMRAFIGAALVKGKVDSHGYIETIDRVEASKLFNALIVAIARGDKMK